MPLRSLIRAERFRDLVFHSVCALSVAGFAAAFARQANLNGDNATHFALARDLWAGRPVFWSAQDANRLFPDELLALLGYALPNGDDYLTWALYYCSLLAVLTYLSIIAFVGVFSEGREQRRTLCLLILTSLTALFAFQPYWPIWLLLPGFHGGGLSICFFALALILRAATGTGKADTGRSLAFLVLVSLVVAANRYLLIAFVAPLLAAVGIEAVRSWTGNARAGNARAATTAATSTGRFGVLTVAAVITAAGVLGIGLWQAVGNLSWMVRTLEGSHPPWPRVSYARWISERLFKEVAEISSLSSDRATIACAVAFLIIVSLMAFWSARSSIVHGAGQRMHRIFSMLVAFSALSSLAFILVMVDDRGPWHYRFLAVPFTLNFVWVVWQCWSRSGKETDRLLRVACCAMLPCIGAVSIYVASQAPEAAHERAFRDAIARLESRLALRSQSGVSRGLADYWIANEVTARSRRIKLSLLEDLTPRYRFLLNNATELCDKDFFFILVNRAESEPLREAILAKLGAPSSTESIDVGRYPKIDIMYYDSAVLDRAVVDPARISAREIYPQLRCNDHQPK